MKRECEINVGFSVRPHGFFIAFKFFGDLLVQPTSRKMGKSNPSKELVCQ